MKLNVPDILAETVGWDDALFGAYLKLLFYQWLNGHIPPPERLASVSPTAAERWDELAHKFPLDGNKSEWVEHQRDEAIEIYEARSRGGRTRAKQVAAAKRRKQNDE
jgi:uncharacterized protein YdaU (DUF1376 family)